MKKVVILLICASFLFSLSVARAFAEDKPADGAAPITVVPATLTPAPSVPDSPEVAAIKSQIEEHRKAIKGLRDEIKKHIDEIKALNEKLRALLPPMKLEEKEKKLEEKYQEKKTKLEEKYQEKKVKIEEKKKAVEEKK